MGGVLKFTEHFFWTVVWVILVLIAAGFVLHLMNTKGILPGVASWVGAHTNLQAQAGG